MKAQSANPEAATIEHSSDDTGGRWGVRLPISPVPAARPRVTTRGFTYYPASYEKFRKTAERLLTEADRLGGPWEATSNPVYVWTFFVLPRPKNPANTFPIGDLDNYEKAIWDSVSKHAGIVKDDKQFIKSTSTKRYAIGSELSHIELVIIEEPDFPAKPGDVYALPEEMRITYEEVMHS